MASINVKGENGKRGISMAPLLPPPHCMSKLITRSDDTEAVVKQRLRIYNEKVSLHFHTISFLIKGYLKNLTMQSYTAILY